MKKYIGLAMALMFAVSVAFVSVASASDHGHKEECHKGMEMDAHGKCVECAHKDAHGECVEAPKKAH